MAKSYISQIASDIGIKTPCFVGFDAKGSATFTLETAKARRMTFGEAANVSEKLRKTESSLAGSKGYVNMPVGMNWKAIQI